MTKYKTRYDQDTDTLHFWHPEHEDPNPNYQEHPPFILETNPVHGVTAGEIRNAQENLGIPSPKQEKTDFPLETDHDTTKELVQFVLQTFPGTKNNTSLLVWWTWRLHADSIDQHDNPENLPSPSTILRARRSLQDKT